MIMTGRSDTRATRCLISPFIGKRHAVMQLERWDLYARTCAWKRIGGQILPAEPEVSDHTLVHQVWK
jgi:hypothetical protein